MAVKLPCLLFLLLVPAFAQVTSFENRPIRDIQISPVQPLDPSDLARALPFQKGDALHSDDIATAIDRLFASGRFEDIVVEAAPSGDGVKLHFVTRLTSFYGGLKVVGRIPHPPNRTQIASATELTLGAPFRDEDLTKAQQAVQDLLKKNGMYQDTVTPVVTRDDSAQQVFLTLQIAGKKRARYEMPVIHGGTVLPEKTILKATGWRLPIVHWWREVTAMRTDMGVQGVLAAYGKKDRLKASVELTNLDYSAASGRVRPTLEIDPGPRVKVTSIESTVPKRVLKRYVPVFEEHAVDDDLLAEGRQHLIDYFQGRGYYDVDVDYRVLPPKDDLETIQYVISRGQRYKVTKISIAGSHYFSEDTIRERMYMQPASFTLRRGRYSEAFQRKDEAAIADLFHSNGFRDVQVTCTIDRNYRNKNGDIAVTVNIDEGPQWMVDDLVLEGFQQVSADKVRDQLASVAGQPFSDVNLASDRAVVLTYYYEHGFPDATFKATATPGHTPHHVNVTYTMTEGQRQYVRRVITSGITRTRPSLVDKYLTLHPDDPLSPVEETEIQKKLYDLGVFARVDTAIQNADGDTDHKYVLYDVDEADRYSLAIGFGLQAGRYGNPYFGNSLSSPGGSTSGSPLMSLDVSRINFLGLGQTVGLHFLYSFLEQRASATYEIPRFLGNKTRTITFTVLYDDSFGVVTFASQREEGSVEVAQKFSKSIRGQIRYAYRRVSVTNVQIPVLLVPQLDQSVRIGMLSANFAQDRRDNPADPHRGIYNTLDFGLAAGAFGSQRSFGRILARNATYHPLTKQLVLARQTQFGIIVPFNAPGGISAAESVPLAERFFGGGPDTLRAFAFDQAGPRDTGAPLLTGGPSSAPTGLPLGGNAVFYNNVELRFPLIGSNIGGVLFEDMGNVFTSLGDMSLSYHQPNQKDFNYTAQAVGFGIRYKTPVGPLRLDLAYALNPPTFVGFKGTTQQLLQCNPNQTYTSGPCVGVPQTLAHFQFFFSIGQTF
jgi:outer membrane protein assembly complex protein YaeT